MWWAPYVGCQFQERGRGDGGAGVDCYGLVYVVYRDVRHVILPRYEDEYNTVADHQRIAEALSRGCFEHADWRMIGPEEVVQTFDVKIFRIRGLPYHCGLVTEPGRMLHVMEGIDGSIERYNTPLWQRRDCGTYRFVPLDTTA